MKRNLDVKNYKTIDDYLPHGYSITWDTTMDDTGEIGFNISLIDYEEQIINDWTCLPGDFTSTIQDIIWYANVDQRNQKINYIIDGKNKKV